MPLFACRRLTFRLAAGAALGWSPPRPCRRRPRLRPGGRHDGAGLRDHEEPQQPGAPGHQAGPRYQVRPAPSWRIAWALGWTKATPDQQRFIKATEQSEAKASRLTLRPVQRPAVQEHVVDAAPSGTTVVDTHHQPCSNGQPLKLAWEGPARAGRGPRITDVKIEGVSMVMTRRSDFTLHPAARRQGASR